MSKTKTDINPSYTRISRLSGYIYHSLSCLVILMVVVARGNMQLFQKTGATKERKGVLRLIFIMIDHSLLWKHLFIAMIFLNYFLQLLSFSLQSPFRFGSIGLLIRVMEDKPKGFWFASTRVQNMKWSFKIFSLFISIKTVNLQRSIKIFEGLHEELRRSLNFFKYNLKYFQFLALQVPVS